MDEKGLPFSWRLGNLVHSIRFRLVAWFMLILVVVMAGFSVFIYLRQIQDLRVIAAARLGTKSQRLLNYLRFPDRNPLPFDPTHAPPGSEWSDPLLQAEDALAVVASDGRVVQSWGPVGDEALQRVAAQSVRDRGGRTLFSAWVRADLDRPNQRTRYFFERIGIRRNDRLVGILVLGSPVDPNGQLPRLLVSLAAGNLLTLALALGGGFWLADRALRPVLTITQAARSIGETDLSRRLNLQSRDELGELAGTFDGMLARLQAAFERQRQFTADASHELRTPLTIVELEASRALTGRRSLGEYERALQTILAENRLMTRLVNNLLTLARMDAGQVRLQTEPLDLSDVALEVVERLAPLAAPRGVSLAVGELPELSILGDRQFLVQMLTNLVENAVKYTAGRPDPRVQVEAGCEGAGPAARAWVRVSDHGPGIPPEHLARIFDRFYQVEAARTGGDENVEGNAAEDTRGSSGAGLGLAIAQWIARAHGGEIRVASEVGQGAAFTVLLPL